MRDGDSVAGGVRARFESFGAQAQKSCRTDTLALDGFDHRLPDLLPRDASRTRAIGDSIERYEMPGVFDVVRPGLRLPTRATPRRRAR